MRRLLVPPVVLATVLFWAAPAFGHAAFVGSSPAPGERLEGAPAAISLTFTEPLNQRLSTATLSRAGNGEPVPVAVIARGERRLELAPRAPLDRGAYRVRWHTVSTLDGHALEGEWSFGIGAPAAGGAHALEDSPLARHGWVRVLARAAFYAAALVLVAALLLPLLVPATRWPVPELPGSGLDTEAVRARARRLTGDLAWVAVGAAVAATLAEAADAAGGLAPGRLADFLLANTAGAARVAVVVLLAGCALTWQRLPRTAAALSVLALAAVAASGHAASAEPRLPSLLNDWLHLTAGAAWLGGIALLALVWAPALRRADRPARLAVARDVLVPFGRVAVPAFALVAATGLASLVVQLGHLDALWETGYGRVLALKIAVVAAIAAASAANALRLRPRLLAANPHPPAEVERRHWGLLRAEPWLGVVVVAAVALLATFPLPPRQLGDADEARAAAAVCDPCPLPRPAADELPVAAQAGTHVAAAWIRRDARGVTGAVRVLDRRGRPATAAISIPGDPAAAGCGPGCLRFRLPRSSDELEVAVRERDGVHTARLPARWRAGANARARRLLAAAEEEMRGLRGVRQLERVTSGPGTLAVTEYRLRAPDRMAWRTGRGVEGIVAGRRQWLRVRGVPWRASEYGSGLAFRTRSWFRWRVYARAVRLLSANGRTAQLALMDEGTPVWFQLTVDLATRRVVDERMVARAHFMHTRYTDFDQPAAIEPP
jgi:copper transport protein